MNKITNITDLGETFRYQYPDWSEMLFQFSTAKIIHPIIFAVTVTKPDVCEFAASEKRVLAQKCLDSIKTKQQQQVHCEK